MKQRKVSLEELIANCEKEYSRWDEIYSNGCRDPCWTDGCNLNLVRNHIISYRKQIESYCAEKSVESPPILLRELPPKLNSDYMAKAEQIREGADKILTKIEQMPDYIGLCECQLGLSPQMRSQCGSQYIMQWVDRLRYAIEKDKLVIMRLHLRQADEIYARISEVLAKANTMPQENYQLSLFDTA